VLGIRGEPGRPEYAENGFVWSSINSHLGDVGFENEWISVVELNRSALCSHPWSLSGGVALPILEHIGNESARKLGSGISSAGIMSVTGEDDFFMRGRPIDLARAGITESVQLVQGEELRDWEPAVGTTSIWTFDKNYRVVPLELLSSNKWLSRFRFAIDHRKRFGVLMSLRGLSWYEWQEIYPSKLTTPLSIAFAFVATHNHFVLDRGGKVFNRSAPVIKLPAGATEDDHLRLLGILNSSTACFWLKQNSHDKGNGGIGGGIGDEKWEPRYEFTGTTLQDFPLPSGDALDRARRLDLLAQQLSALAAAAVIDRSGPDRDALFEAESEAARTRLLMIAEQEELDWEVYRLYGLIDEDLTYPHTSDSDRASDPRLPGIALGERAFEIALARKIENGTETTEWFARHGSTPITEIPDHWPDPACQGELRPAVHCKSA